MLDGQLSSSQLKSGETVGHLVCLVYVKGCAKLISSPLAVILFNYLRRVNNSDFFSSFTAKTMASASVCLEPDERGRSVGRAFFTEPKPLPCGPLPCGHLPCGPLPCGHLPCRHCLVSWMKTRKEALRPLCRCVIIEVNQPGLQSLEDIADGFPTDLAMDRGAGGSPSSL